MNIHATDTKAAIAGFAPASLSDRATTYALDAVRSIGRFAMRRVRTADVVDSEYNMTHWQRTLSEKAWTKTASISDFLVPKNSAQSLRKVDNQICRVAAEDYYRYRARALGDLLARHAGGAKEIVEPRHRLRHQPALAPPQPSRLEAARLRHRAERHRRGPRDRCAFRPVRPDLARQDRSDRRCRS